jgi:hypothetical protein
MYISAYALLYIKGVFMNFQRSYPLLSGVTATNDGTATAVQYTAPNGVLGKGVHVSLTGTGSLTATVSIDVSHDGVNWITPGAGTFTLSGSTSVQEGTVINVPFAYIKANLSALTGTGATVSVYVGV